jgi:hypothetical protein
MAHSGLSVTLALAEADQRAAITMLIEVARSAFHAADNSEDDGDPEWIKVDRASFDAMSDALDKLDTLPDDQPGYVMGPAAKAEWALRALFPTVPGGVNSPDGAQR